MRLSEAITLQEASGKLSDVAEINTNMPDADFWIIRKGTEDRVGEPTKTFSPEHIGVKVDRASLVPDYLYYVMMNIHNQGYWKNVSYGSLALKNIRVSDVRNIPLGGMG